MIEIICDQYGLSPYSENDVIVREDSDYENGLNCLEEAVFKCAPLRLIVKNPAIFKWFDAPAKKYGCVIKRIDPVEEFKNAIRRSIVPEDLRKRPDFIIDLNLLEEAQKQPIKTGESSEEWLKRLLLGDLWKKAIIETSEELAAVLSWFASNQEKDFHSFCYHMIDEQLANWQKSSPEQSDVLKWLRPDPFKRSLYLAWEQSLGTYPPNRVAEWLQNDGIWFVLTQLNDRHRLTFEIKFNGRLPGSIEIFLKAFLEETWAQSPEKALVYISGRLEVEKVFLTEALRKRLNEGAAIDKALFDQIAAFKAFPDIKELAAELLPPPPPTFPKMEYTVFEMQNWLSSEYLPFYHSCSLLNTVESTVEYVEFFEKWLKQNYTSMLINGNGVAYRQLRDMREKVKDAPLLIVLFDGLDFFNAKNQILPILKEKGLHPTSRPLPYFSFLPSETFIAKPAVISGKMKSQIPDESPGASFYRELLQQAFHLSPDMVRAATDKQMGLKELVFERASVYLYLDNQLDREYLHAVFKPYFRQKKYIEHVKKQAEEISEAVDMIKELYHDEPLVVICSDHGHTVLPSSVEVIQTGVAEKSKPRSLFISKTNKSKLDVESVWILQQDLFGLNEEMAIPSAYKCFDRRPKGATHGGATPQELSVPWFVLSSKSEQALQAINMIIEGEIHRRKRDNTVYLVISNPNDYGVTLLDCQLKHLDLKGELPLELPKNGVKKILASIDASEIGENRVEISGRGFVSSNTEEKEFDVNIIAQTTGAMRDEFDDEFEI